MDTATNPNGVPPQYSAAWHHLHLYSPRSVLAGSSSNMPAYKFLYEKRRDHRRTLGRRLEITGPDAPRTKMEVVPSYDAKCLVAYLMSLDQSHELKEVKLSSASAPCARPPAPRQGGKEMNESARGGHVRQGMDYGEDSDVHQVHSAIQREKREPRAGLEPLSIWLIAVYGSRSFSEARISVDSLETSAGTVSTRPSSPTQKLRAQMAPVLDIPRNFPRPIAARRFSRPTARSVINRMDSARPGRGTRRWRVLNIVNGGTRRIGMIVLKGLQGPITVKGQSFGTAVMQPWDKTLTDAKIADVLTYIRQEWGNKGGPVATAQIAGLRKELASHPDSFVEADLKAVPEDAELPGGEPAGAKPADTKSPRTAAPPK